MSLRSSGSCSFSTIAAVVWLDITTSWPICTPERATTFCTSAVMSMNSSAWEVWYSSVSA